MLGGPLPILEDLQPYRLLIGVSLYCRPLSLSEERRRHATSRDRALTLALLRMECGDSLGAAFCQSLVKVPKAGLGVTSWHVRSHCEGSPGRDLGVTVADPCINLQYIQDLTPKVHTCKTHREARLVQEPLSAFIQLAGKSRHVSCRLGSQIAGKRSGEYVAGAG